MLISPDRSCRADDLLDSLGLRAPTLRFTRAIFRANARSSSNVMQFTAYQPPSAPQISLMRHIQVLDSVTPMYSITSASNFDLLRDSLTFSFLMIRRPLNPGSLGPQPDPSVSFLFAFGSLPASRLLTINNPDSLLAFRSSEVVP